MRIRPIHIIISSFILGVVFTYEWLGNMYAAVPLGILEAALVSSLAEEVLNVRA